MGGGFGSKLGAGPAGADLRAAGEGGEGAGQADARSQGRASRDRQPAVGGGAGQGGRRRRRHADRVRRRIVGHRRRRRGGRVPAAVHLPVPEPAPHAQGRLHQHRPAAPDARPGPPAGLLHHRSADGGARRPREDGSGRVPDQEPAARSAQCDVGGVPPPAAPTEFGWDKRHPTGDPDARPDQDRHGRGDQHLGRRRPRPSAAHIEISSDGARRRPLRHTGSRHRHADADRGRRRRYVRPAGERDSSRRSATRCIPISGGSGGSTTAAAVSPAVRIATVNALDALKEKVAPALGVEPATLVAAGGRIHVKDNPSKGMSWAEACKQLGTQPISVEGNWQPGLSSVTTSGVQFAEVTVDIETGIVKVTRVLAHPGLRPGRQPAHRREPGLRRRHRVAELRAVRGSHPRSQHRADGEPEHGVVPARGDVGHAEDRRPARSISPSAA